MAAGYSAIGDVREHLLLILYGSGANGKSTFIETIRAALGDYAHRTRTEILMAKAAGNGATPELANLKGKRFVTASESEDGQRLAESLIKDLTGGDTITARHLYKEPFEFRPTHTLWLSTNHRPVIRGTDEGIWRRIRLVPFTVRIPDEQQDKRLPERLREDELSGVLAWMVRGALMWQQSSVGLDVPDEVRKATQQYRDDMDRIKQFVVDECVIGRWEYRVTKDELYSAYREWVSEGGEYPESKRRFGQRLKEKYSHIEEDRYNDKTRTRIWRGIGLRAK
jgi:putative DNA primase/helicase